MKKALITGVTGQDGSYMAELLLEKGYQVYGLQRRTSTPNTERIDHIYDNPEYKRFITIYGDLTDSSNLSSVIARIEPDEIYNLGAQSHVKVSFQVPEYTANVTALGTLRLLEAIRQLKMPCRFYQASSSEMFGKADLTKLQNELTVFNPQSPYGLSKVFSYYITKIYRDSYDMFATNGILFNHESPRRGITFVTRKITIGLSRVKLGMQSVLRLGNLDSRRDWGYAKDYVEGIYRIMQYKKAEDFVLATGETHTVREFVENAAKNLNITIVWSGTGVNEKGIDKKTGKTLIEIDVDYFRPQDVEYLQGDSSKARKLLEWKPKVSFQQLVELMVKSDYDLMKLERKTGRKVAVRTIA
jgi:GDPmannose 4,6-dehydratase